MTLPSCNHSPPRPRPPSSSSPPSPPSAVQIPAHPAVAKAADALASLIDAGLTLDDPRVQTFLALIRNFNTHAAHSSSSPSLSPHDAKIHAPHPPRAADNNNTTDRLQQSIPNPLLANAFHDAPPKLLPIAAHHPSSHTRSFLPHNQATVVAARLSVERNIDRSVSHSQSTPIVESTPAPHAPPTVFQAARQLSSSGHSQSTALDSSSSSLSQRTASDGTATIDKQTSSSPSSSSPVVTKSVPFVAKRIANLPAPHALQIKAQAEAFRRLVRGMDIPTELRIAARGIAMISIPNSVKSTPLVTPPAPVVERGSTDPDPESTDPASATDPSLVTSSPELFDPRRLPDFLLDHVLQNHEVLMPGEQENRVAATELRDRLLVAQIDHMQRHVQRNSVAVKELSKRQSSTSVVDGRVSQVRSGIIDNIISDVILNHSDETGTMTASRGGLQHCTTQRRERVSKPQATNDLQEGNSEQAKPSFSVSLQRASAPISVASTPARVPSLEALQQARERRVTGRIQARLQEIADMLSTASDDVRQALLTEQKQLRLLPLQMKVRKRIMACMHRTLHRPGIADLSVRKVMRVRHKMTTSGSLSSNHGLANHPSISTHALNMSTTSRTEQAYRQQQKERRMARRSNILQALTTHSARFKTAVQQRIVLQKRLLKDLERFFRDRSREEERRKKKEQLDRLRALRNNNEDEYLELLKTTKNKRLIQLLRQTDEYLMQIGAQVERQKQAARDEDAGRHSGHPTAANDDEIKANGEDENSQCDDDELSQLRKRRNDYYTITHTISEKVHQPKCLVGGTLKHYQLEGLEWLVSLYNNNLNGILADEMGLGKTIQTLSLITYLVEVKNVYGPFLVIVPLSVMSNWTRELDRWAPSLVRVVYKGDPASRKNIQMNQMQGGNFNVLLTTYEFVVKDKNVLGRIRWKYIIMDEGHRMKNAECKLALTLGAKYSSRNRLLLTGTPLQNNMTELWALLNFLLPTIFSSADTFETWFNAPFQASSLGDTAELNEEENLLIISRLHQVLRPFMLRRLKTDVESQLPDKVENVFRCNMSAWQRVLYRQMRQKLGIAGGNFGIRSFNNIMMQLKKVCNHPFLFYYDEELISLPPDNLIRAAGKFELLNHVLRKLKQTGHRVLMFSQMTSALDYLQYFLSSAGMKHLRLDGTTKADDRQEMLEMFNAEGSDYFCFLLSTRAGGLGLNLQTADTVIIFDSDWNPMMDLQAQDRAHRIGQTKEVRVFRLICSGSVEVKILERATRKLQIESQVIQAGQFNNKSSDNDRHEMLKDLLRQQMDDDFARSDVTSLDEINRKLARSEEEVVIFEQIDAELQKERGAKPALMEDEDELPKWVLKPEQEVKDKEQTEAEFNLEHGRGRRKRKQVMYDDNLTEREWTMAMEEEGDIEEAVKRKKRRIMMNVDANDNGETIMNDKSSKADSDEDYHATNNGHKDNEGDGHHDVNESVARGHGQNNRAAKDNGDKATEHDHRTNGVTPSKSGARTNHNANGQIRKPAEPLAQSNGENLEDSGRSRSRRSRSRKSRR